MINLNQISNCVLPSKHTFFIMSDVFGKIIGVDRYFVDYILLQSAMRPGKEALLT